MTSYLIVSGPRGIRTLDLLNAIETRSQLRYGPLFIFVLSDSPNCKSGGPEGIRTPDLLIAIESRSQLRYRPINKAKNILLEALGDVKQTFIPFGAFSFEKVLSLNSL